MALQPENLACRKTKRYRAASLSRVSATADLATRTGPGWPQIASTPGQERFSGDGILPDEQSRVCVRVLRKNSPHRRARRCKGYLALALSGARFILTVDGNSRGRQDSINTGTTIITFVMVFLIQNTQNRDSMN